MSDVVSWVFYLVLFALSSGLIVVGMTAKRPVWLRRTLISVGVALPVLAATFRYNVGTDYVSYDSKYNIARSSSIDSLVSSWSNDFWSYIEPSFFVISKLTGLITHESYLMFGVYSLITFALFYLAVRNTPLKKSPILFGLAVFLFLCTIFPQSFNSVRQLAALAIGVYAVTRVVRDGSTKGSVTVGVLLSALAATFHYTAIIYVPIVLLVGYVNRIPERRRLLVLIMVPFISTLVLYLFFIAFGSLPIFHKYIITEFASVGALVNASLVNNAVKFSAVLLLFRPTVKSYPSVYAYYVIMSLALAATALVPVNSLFSRFTVYFNVFFVILAPIVILANQKRGRHFLAVGVTGLVLFSAAVFTQSYYIGGAHDVIPYSTVDLRRDRLSE